MKNFKTVGERLTSVFESLKEQFNWKNTMQSTKIVRVVVSSGIGRLKDDKNRHKVIQERLTSITGQKPKYTKAKKSIASFKLREGDIVGYSATLNGAKRCADFLTRFFFVALPRSRDFQGIPIKAIDKEGNITIGISEHIIFTETSDEDLKDIFGFSITIVTTAQSKEEAEAFFRHIGLPLKKKETVATQ